MKPLRRPQKEKEKILFEKFIELIRIKTSNVEQPSPPNPDITFETDEKKIGVEISEIYSDKIGKVKGSQLRQHESLREKVLELAIRQVEKSIPWPFELHVTYNNKDITNEEVKPLAQTIAYIVLEQLDNVKPTSEFKIIKYDNTDYKINLNKISIYVHENLDKHYYMPVAAGRVPHLKTNNLVNAIAKKERKIEGYTMNCDLVWLLLIELGSLASSFDDVEKALNKIYQSNFDRIFLLRTMRNELLEVQTVG